MKMDTISQPSQGKAKQAKTATIATILIQLNVLVYRNRKWNSIDNGQAFKCIATFV